MINRITNLLLFSLLAACADESGDANILSNFDRYVQSAKLSVFKNLDESITLGQAFDNYKFFKNTSWHSFTDEQGREVVEFVGEFDREKFSYIQNYKTMLKGMTVQEFEETFGEKYDPTNPNMVNALKIGVFALKFKDKQVDAAIDAAKELINLDISIKYKSQFSFSLVDDSINFGYECIVLECHEDSLQTSHEFPNSDVKRYIYANEEYLSIGELHSAFLKNFVHPLKK